MDREIAVRERERPSEPASPLIRRPLPWLVISLIILSWVIFLYSLYRNDCPSQTTRRGRCLIQGALGRLSFQPLKENPQYGPALNTLADLGGFRWSLKKEETKKWHIMSSIFFHRGLASLIPNTISLLYTAMELEQNFGTVKIGSLYIFSSLGGSIWAALKFRGVVYVGGSTGVCGLTGGSVAELFINLNMHEEKFKKFLSLCLGVAINFTVKLFPGVDVSGNIGGLYFGFLLGFLLLIRCEPDNSGFQYKHSDFHPRQLILTYRRFQWVLWVIALISAIILFLYSLIKFILH